MKNLKEILKGKTSKILLFLVALTVVGALLFSTLALGIVASDPEVKMPKMVVTIGNPALAAGIPDYACDGTNDHLDFAAALAALPSGGKVQIVSAGTYTFGASVTITANNITIEGTGLGTIIDSGASPAFVVVGTGCVIKDLSIAATGSIFASDDATLMNVSIDGNYIAYQLPSTGTAADLVAPTGRQAAFLVAGSDAPDIVKAQADWVGHGTGDQVELQAAVDALPAGGGLINIYGKLVLSSGVTTGTKGVMFDGGTWAANQTALGVNLATSSMITADQDDFTWITMGDAAKWSVAGGFRNIAFLGNENTITNATNPIFKAVNHSDGFIQNCIFGMFNQTGGDTTTPIIQLSGTHAWGWWIENNDIEDANMCGLYLEGHRNFIVNNHFRDLVQGIYLKNTQGAPEVDAYVTNNDFLLIKQNPIYITGTSHGFVCTGNTFAAFSSTTPQSYGFIGGGLDPLFDSIICNNTWLKTNYPEYGEEFIAKTGRFINCVITGNSLGYSTGTNPVISIGANSYDNIIEGNLGYVSNGEIRTYAEDWKTGAAGEAIMAWQNPNDKPGIVKVTGSITTGGAATSIADFGLATTVLVVDDCEVEWTDGAPAHGTNTTTTSYLKRGTYANSTRIDAGIVNGNKVAISTFGAKDISTATHLLFWITTSVAISTADLAIMLDDSDDCASPTFTLNIPPLLIVKPTLVCLAINGGAAAGISVQSVGLQVLDAATLVSGKYIYIDDVRAITVGNTVLDDVDISPAAVPTVLNGTAIYVGAKNNDDYDCIIGRSETAASTGLDGQWAVTYQAVN